MDGCLHWVSKICGLNHLILKDTHRIQQLGEGCGLQKLCSTVALAKPHLLSA